MNILTESMKIRWIKRIIHLLLLLIIFVGPELVFSIGRTMHKLMLLTPLCYIVLFYINYYVLIDKYMFDKKKLWIYISFNIILLLGTIAIFYCVETALRPPMDVLPEPPVSKPGSIPPPPLHGPIQPGFMQTHILRSLTMFPRIGTMALLSVILAVVMKLSEKWVKWESQKQKMKAELQENELKNLKNQLNPHFLFNTLNNIYALIPISQERAQKTIHELSQLLRYILYDNDTREVPLEKDLQFVKNYISLMRLRLNSLVTLRENINAKEGQGKTIAPLLFISLVENAFKHGVSGEKPSFIDIAIDVHGDEVHCHVENSYFPKKENDKSGSGIGISNLKRQLDILYSGKYTFSITKNAERYVADLTIELTSQNL